jgi:hypothetical protein
MTKIKAKEHFLSVEGECDKKNKLLKSDARLTEEEVRRLDSGNLTIEDLEGMLAKKARIFRYRTQITVHADFPREVKNRVNGYAYLVNNKNGSVGIRYGAIDETKRRQLYRFLSHENFRYFKDSSHHDFIATQTFTDREAALGYIAELKSKYDYDALRALIYGSIGIYGSIVWGRYNVELVVRVNAIPENNVPEFLKLLGCKSEAEIAGIEKNKLEETRRWFEQNREERKEQKAKYEEEARAKRLEFLAGYREKHKQIDAMPDGECSLCVVTDNADRVVIKQFFLKNGKKMVKQFRPYRRYGSPKHYELWNDVMPTHSVMGYMSRLDEATLQRYFAEGAVFSL